MILRIESFGYMQKKFSLIELEEACQVDIHFMYLAENETLSFIFFQRFIQDKLTQSLEENFMKLLSF